MLQNTLAAESVIRDVDMADEMTKFSKNQILAQAGTAMLAQANQAGQPLPEAAHAFIDFFLREEIALANYDYIGYAPCYEEFFAAMVEDYGYDLPVFDPFPEGAIRQIYVYGTDARSQRITQILANAKDED